MLVEIETDEGVTGIGESPVVWAGQADVTRALLAGVEHLVVGADRFKAMDEQGIDMEAISINPFWYHVDRDKAEALIKLQNEKLAALCAAQPDRFVAFASVALQYPDLAAEQLELSDAEIAQLEEPYVSRSVSF